MRVNQVPKVRKRTAVGKRTLDLIQKFAVDALGMEH